MSSAKTIPCGHYHGLHRGICPKCYREDRDTAAARVFGQALSDMEAQSRQSAVDALIDALNGRSAKA